MQRRVMVGSRTDEALLLIDYAMRTWGTIIEVGSYYGRSAMVLAYLQRPMICIDPWADGFADTSGDSNFASFLENIDSTGFSANITPIRSRVEDAKPVKAGFVYLDGDHTYEGTVAQINWGLLCEPDCIALHDVNDEGGGRVIKKAALELLGPWKEREGRLAVWELN